MEKTGIILVHGVSGSHTDLYPIELLFSDKRYLTLNIELPNHNSNFNNINFNAETFQNNLIERINKFSEQLKQYILIGHSTGGTLLLSILNKLNKPPTLNIMLATPYKVDMSYIERWDNSTKNKDTRMDMDSMAELIALINQQSRKKDPCNIHTLIFQAIDDELVPYSDSEKWHEKLSSATSKLIRLENGNHHFIQKHSDYIFQKIMTELNLMTNKLNNTDILSKIDPQIVTHTINSPQIQNNLVNSPSVKRALKKEIELSKHIDNKPVFANIEITTRCNFKCSFCAREHVNIQEIDMSISEFDQILSKLPSVYKVRIVGLGEPLLHKQISEFIRCAKSYNKHVGIVTNAQLLTENIGKDIIKAGLDEITFSIDSTVQNIAQEIRKGSNISKILENINAFLTLDGSEDLRTAVFTAISKQSLSSLEKTIEDICKLNIQAIVLSDLNFEDNIEQSVNRNMTDKNYETIKNAILTAYRNGKPVINSRAIEEFGIENRIRDFLIKTPEQIFEKSTKHTWCLSPWQTLPVLVNGDITVCDCQPETRTGNILKDNLDEIWNSQQFQMQRKGMISEHPIKACKSCPRF